MNELHGYTHHPERAARLIRITAEGVWLDMITLEDPYPVAEAIETVMAGLKALYPAHF
jgi:TetR/AcrR family transcriptional repressor of bet genes